MEIQAKVYNVLPLEVLNRDKDFFVLAGTEMFTIDVLTSDTPRELAERVFAMWNHGSGMESEGFLHSGVRSLSVGDIVAFPELETSLACQVVGWTAITPNPDRMIDSDQIVDLGQGDPDLDW